MTLSIHFIPRILRKHLLMKFCSFWVVFVARHVSDPYNKTDLTLELKNFSFSFGFQMFHNILNGLLYSCLSLVISRSDSKLPGKYIIKKARIKHIFSLTCETPSTWWPPLTLSVALLSTRVRTTVFHSASCTRLRLQSSAIPVPQSNLLQRMIRKKKA